MNQLSAAVIQQASKGMNKSENLAVTAELVTQAAKVGAKLVVLQELHTTNYFCDDLNWNAFDLAEPLDGETTSHLADLAKRLDITLVGSIYEKRMPGVYHNTAVVLDGAAGLVGHYRKMHIPDDPGFTEKFYFTPGDAKTNSSAFAPIQTRVGKLGVLVCWDQWYPEAARLSALQGADVLIYPTAIGWDPNDTADEQARQREAWTLIQRSHAVANHLPVLVANRVGTEAGTTFWGQSFITGGQGEFLIKAELEQGFYMAELELHKTEQLRRVWPFFRDRRVDAYEGLLQRSLV